MPEQPPKFNIETYIKTLTPNTLGKQLGVVKKMLGEVQIGGEPAVLPTQAPIAPGGITTVSNNAPTEKLPILPREVADMADAAARGLPNPHPELGYNLVPLDPRADPYIPPERPEETPRSANFGQVVAELQSVDPNDPTIQDYSKYFEGLNDSALAERREHLADTLSAGLTPAGLSELLALSEDVATKLEQQNNWKPELHRYFVINARNTLYAGSMAPTEERRPPADPEKPPADAADTFSERVNSRLETAEEDQISFPATLDELADYANNLELYEGATIRELDPQRTAGGIQLRGVVNAGGSNSPFEVYLANPRERLVTDKPRRVEVIGKPELKLPRHLFLIRRKIEPRLANFNELITGETDKKINPRWATTGFRITDTGVEFDFTSKDRVADDLAEEYAQRLGITPEEARQKALDTLKKG